MVIVWGLLRVCLCLWCCLRMIFGYLIFSCCMVLVWLFGVAGICGLLLGVLIMAGVFVLNACFGCLVTCLVMFWFVFV